MEEKKKGSSGFAIASLVLGILAIVNSFIPFLNVVSYIMGVLAVIFGIIGIIKKIGRGMAIAGLILGVISFVVATSINVGTSKVINDVVDETNNEIEKVTGNKTDEVLKNDVEVNLGNLNISTDEYGFTDSYMDVVVKNKLDIKKSFSIHVEAVDENGNRIEDDYVYANDLGPNQSQTFKIFTYIEDSKLDSMRNAKFNIVEASVY